MSDGKLYSLVFKNQSHTRLTIVCRKMKALIAD